MGRATADVDDCVAEDEGTDIRELYRLLRAGRSADRVEAGDAGDLAPAAAGPAATRRALPASTPKILAPSITMKGRSLFPPDSTA